MSKKIGQKIERPSFNLKYQVNPYAILLWETYLLQFIFFTFDLGFPNKRRFRGNIFLFSDQEKETKKGINGFLQSSHYNPTSVPAALLHLTSTVENRSVQCSRG